MMRSFVLLVVASSVCAAAATQEEEAIALPVVDLLGAAGESSGDALLRALRDVGAAVVDGHGVDSLDEVLAATRRLFQQTDQPPFQDDRGYLPRGGESGGSGVVEAKESFAFKRTENAWPSTLEARDRDLFDRAFAQLCAAAHRVVALLPMDAHCCDGDADDASLARLFHYFPADPAVFVGSAPHTDWGLLTFVLADQPGLELLVAENEWRPPNSSSSSSSRLVLHAGDFMALTLAGVRSPRHRVRVHPDRDRFSLVFFAYPNSDAPVPTSEAAPPGLSLNECQADDPDVCASAPSPRTFGALVAEKWAQVRRQQHRDS